MKRFQFNTYTLIILFFIALFSSSCKDFDEITVVGIDGFHLNKFSMDGIDAEVNVKIKNPNAMAFTIYPSEFDVAFSGIRLGKANLNKRMHISSNSEKTYAFNLKSGFGNLNILDVTRLLNSGNWGKVEVKGDLKVGKLFVKKKVPVDFSERINLTK